MFWWSLVLLYTVHSVQGMYIRGFRNRIRRFWSWCQESCKVYCRFKLGLYSKILAKSGYFSFFLGSFYEKLHETAKFIVFSSLEKFLDSIAIRYANLMIIWSFGKQVFSKGKDQIFGYKQDLNRDHVGERLMANTHNHVSVTKISLHTNHSLIVFPAIFKFQNSPK